MVLGEFGRGSEFRAQGLRIRVSGSVFWVCVGFRFGVLVVGFPSPKTLKTQKNIKNSKQGPRLSISDVGFRA